jgi:hypothetical protein
MRIDKKLQKKKKTRQHLIVFNAKELMQKLSSNRGQ